MGATLATGEWIACQVIEVSHLPIVHRLIVVNNDYSGVDLDLIGIGRCPQVFQERLQPSTVGVQLVDERIDKEVRIYGHYNHIAAVVDWIHIRRCCGSIHAHGLHTEQYSTVQYSTTREI